MPILSQLWRETTTEDELRHLWDLETIGIDNKQTVHESFESNVSFEDGRYKVNLPLKERHDLLPDNHELSLGHLKPQVDRLGRTQSF